MLQHSTFSIDVLLLYTPHNHLVQAHIQINWTFGNVEKQTDNNLNLLLKSLNFWSILTIGPIIKDKYEVTIAEKQKLAKRRELHAK